MADYKRTVMVEPATLRAAPLGIWLRKRPPPDAARLLRSVTADSARAEVALLPAMPPPSAACSLITQTRAHKGTKGRSTQLLGQTGLTVCGVGCEGRPADGLPQVVGHVQTPAVASCNVGGEVRVGNCQCANPAAAPR
jgi:hypothetical protein